MVAVGRALVAGGVSVVVALAMASGCSASDGGASPGGGGGNAGNGASTGGSGGSDSGVIDAPVNDGALTADSACAEYSAEAKQAPAAMLIVLDQSLSMAQSGKWTAAQLAIVQAIDTPAFDNMSLGLLVYPAGQVPGPTCLLGLNVWCGVSALAQVPLTDTGFNKSSAPGVRQNIYNWLSSHQPVGDSTPGYDALKAAIDALQLYPTQGSRLILLISDGGFGCTSLSNRPGFMDQVNCPDWEDPQSVISLLGNAHDDPNKPVQTFVVGVPGSDTKPGSPNDPPYYMRRALSAFALAGSKETVPAGCDGTWSQSAADPSLACHFDLTQGNFNASALAQTISDIRGKALGCVYQLPEPQNGETTVNKDKVNVEVTINGVKTTVPKRTDKNDTCEAAPCWDYDAQDQIVLIGKACEDLSKATDAKIDIVVGCDTIVK